MTEATPLGRFGKPIDIAMGCLSISGLCHSHCQANPAAPSRIDKAQMNRVAPRSLDRDRYFTASQAIGHYIRTQSLNREC